jgi:amino acid adenylation domain-containing protein
MTELSPEPSTLIELLSSRASRQPADTAYSYLADGEGEEVHLSYGELDRRARLIGARLQSLGAARSRILLLYPPGLDYIAAFFGCLYAGAVAVPAYPPRLNRNLSRLQAIVADAQATVALTTESGLSKMESLSARFPESKSLRWVATDGLAEVLTEEWRDPKVEGDDLAFLQYTSGSTATPKGVMVSHANVLHNERLIQSGFKQSSQSVIVGWLPLYHDMGLIGNMLQAVYVGAPAILMSPAAFLQRPLRWLNAISRYKATTSGGPNFAYDLCVRSIRPEQMTTLDLSSWVVAFNGAEPIRADSLERFALAFEPYGFRREAFSPCYGLAEATLMVSSGTLSATRSVRNFEAKALERNHVRQSEMDAGHTRTLVSCGQVPAEQKVVIVNPESLTPCAAEQIGEVWVSGPSVAKGYWNHPEETAETFGSRLAETGERPFLRTGDLGFLLDGELFIAGRLKDLLIIRGRNHYPQDIELTAEQSHPALRRGGGAAFSIEVGSEEQIVVVQELESARDSDLAPVNLSSITEGIFRAVAEEHEVAVHAVMLVKPGRIPRTSSGKIQRRACRQQFINGEMEAVAEQRRRLTIGVETPDPAPPESFQSLEELERWLASQLSSRVGIDPEEIDARQPITRYGLDSLNALELTQSIHGRLGVSLPLTTFLQDITIKQLAAELLPDAEPRSARTRLPASSTETCDEYPLSHGQQALWYLQQLSPNSAAYNIAAAIRIVDELDVRALHGAFQRLVERHPMLRTTFAPTPTGPVQHVRRHQSVCFRQVDAAGWDDESLNERLVEETRSPFDLEHGPLLRVSLYMRSARESVLLLIMHHIAADYWSLAILTHELGLLYRAEGGGEPSALPPLTLQYADHVLWQSGLLSGAEGEKLLAYWRKKLAGELPLLDLPADRPRPPAQSFQGAAESFRLDAELAIALRSFSRAHGVTLYMTLLAAFQALIHRYTNQREVLVGSPVAGRAQAESAGVVGYFVNPVVLRASFSGGQTFADFLQEVRRTVLEALEHQDYPFALLVEHLQPTREAGRAPLFEAMFVLQKDHLSSGEIHSVLPLGEPGEPLDLGGLRVEPFPLKQTVTQFDLTLKLTELGEELAAAFEYSTDLFDAPTIRRMADHFQTLLRAVVTDPAVTVSRIPLLSDAERQLRLEWNDTTVDYAGEPRLLHQLFETQAERTPEAAALRFAEQQLSYRELNQRANQLARHLQGLGVGQDVAVGVCMERCVEMVVSLLAILKAGGAYLPLDPYSPATRVSFMMTEAGVGVLLTESRWREQLPLGRAQVVCVDNWEAELTQASGEAVVSRVSPENLAYIIYTSGSTGQPKGVMNRHSAIVNRLLWMQGRYNLGSADRVLQKTVFTFDVSVWEFFWPLITGACLVLARPGGHRESTYLVQVIQEQRITVLHFVPSMLRAFLEEEGVSGCTTVRDVICSGEALSVELQERFYECLTARLHNLYGPTEAAVDVTAWECERGREIVPIGCPIANTQLYIFNEEVEASPVGVAGELYIGGAGLARGYVNQPGLTAEKFVPHPLATEGGERLYRTGDLARFLPDGNIEFLGRLDHQVKIRGFRIELGEIEAVLKQHPAVSEAIVLARQEAGSETRLGAYILPCAGAEVPTTVEWRRHLQQQLPEYMIPSAFVTLEELPLTSSAKVDRRALLSMKLGGRPDEMPYVAPRTATEQLVADIWSQLLGVERVGLHDNFFELGGHSLLATQFTSRLRERFNVDVPLSALFTSVPTVEGMTKTIEEYQIKQAEAQDIDELLKTLDGLSDEEVRRLLVGKRI